MVEGRPRGVAGSLDYSSVDVLRLVSVISLLGKEEDSISTSSHILLMTAKWMSKFRFAIRRKHWGKIEDFDHSTLDILNPSINKSTEEHQSPFDLISIPIIDTIEMNVTSQSEQEEATMPSATNPFMIINERKTLPLSSNRTSITESETGKFEDMEERRSHLDPLEERKRKQQLDGKYFGKNPSFGNDYLLEGYDSDFDEERSHSELSEDQNSENLMDYSETLQELNDFVSSSIYSSSYNSTCSIHPNHDASTELVEDKAFVISSFLSILGRNNRNSVNPIKYTKTTADLLSMNNQGGIKDDEESILSLFQSLSTLRRNFIMNSESKDGVEEGLELSVECLDELELIRDELYHHILRSYFTTALTFPQILPGSQHSTPQNVSGSTSIDHTQRHNSQKRTFSSQFSYSDKPLQEDEGILELSRGIWLASHLGSPSKEIESLVLSARLIRGLRERQLKEDFNEIVQILDIVKRAHTENLIEETVISNEIKSVFDDIRLKVTLEELKYGVISNPNIPFRNDHGELTVEITRDSIKGLERALGRVELMGGCDIPVLRYLIQLASLVLKLRRSFKSGLIEVKVASYLGLILLLVLKPPIFSYFLLFLIELSTLLLQKLNHELLLRELLNQNNTPTHRIISKGGIEEEERRRQKG